MFWLVTRTASKKDAHNLVLEYAEVEGKFTLNICGKSKVRELDTTDFPKVPYLTNPAKIPKHTKLVTLVDVELERIGDKVKSDLVKEKEAKAKAMAAEGGGLGSRIRFGCLGLGGGLVGRRSPRSPMEWISRAGTLKITKGGFWY